jgi:uncharacterized protein
MKWTAGGSRSNVDDLRGAGGGGGGFGGGGGGMGRMGLGGTVVLLILSLIFGRNLIGGGGSAAPGGTVSSAAGGDVPPTSETAQEAQRREFATFVLNDVQDTWRKLLPASGGPQYQDARLALFRDGVDTGCGQASSDAGPFYCPPDHEAYIDLAFFDELSTRFGASGDFAQAYVLAHELGHHVQNLLGTDARVRQLQESRPNDANQLSVRLELQADCYAGVWANSTEQRRLLEAGDVDEALAAASAVGDDRLQKQATGRVRPDTFTHGTAAQRANWFKRGYTTGRPDNCDTFAGAI